MRPFLFLAVLLICLASVYGQNEQAPILEKEIAYKDWTLKSVRDGKDLNFRDLAKGKKLVAVVYFAPWCHNWQHDAPMLQRFYDKYRGDGFEIVAVGEYGTVDAMKTNLDNFKLTFPAVYESQKQSDYQNTLHFAYRQSTGDKRKWGSPYYILIEPGRMETKGDVLVTKTDIINGEMIETEGEQYIRRKLGLSSVQTKPVSSDK
jgi:thiol-disulfide isomerase/thioredoxin